MSDYLIGLRNTPSQIMARQRIEAMKAQRNVSPQQFVQQVQSNPRESRLVAESVNTSLACAGAVLGWIAIIGATAIVPFTGGAGLVITTLGVPAASASSVQCVAGAARVYTEVNNPEALDRLDNQQWYQDVSTEQ